MWSFARSRGRGSRAGESRTQDPSRGILEELHVGRRETHTTGRENAPDLPRTTAGADRVREVLRALGDHADARNLDAYTYGMTQSRAPHAAGPGQHTIDI